MGLPALLQTLYSQASRPPAAWCRFLLAWFGAAAMAASGQTFFPIKDVRPGLHGTGRTVFAGDRIETFDVEILGVLPNVVPKQMIILARLSGGPLAHTGILQGMSGSPVYIDGKLLGAVALGFAFSKDPIAGIQPIEDMLAAGAQNPPGGGGSGLPGGSWRFFGKAGSLPASLAENISVPTPYGPLTDLLTPVSLAGFSTAAAPALARQFEALGFEQVQVTPSGPPVPETARTGSSDGQLRPGSMISVGLLTGDMNIAADGTVTYIDGKRIYAFGHRFLNAGSTEMPFARSQVLTLIPNVNTSFKLSAPQEWIGTILSDRAAAISGEIGRAPHTIPMTVSLRSQATGTHDYKFQVINDRFLTPVITQTALASLLDSTERALGRGTLQLSGTIEWEGNEPPLRIHDTFVSDTQVAQQVALDAVVPFGFVLSAGFDGLRPKRISFVLQASETKNLYRLTQAWTSAHEVRPGEAVEVTALLEGENGQQLHRSTVYRVPAGVPTGPLNFTLSDATTLNFPEFAGLSPTAAHTPGDLIGTINGFRDNDALYVRVWRPEPSFTIAGTAASGEIDDPPPSVALILSDPSSSATSNSASVQTRGSDMAELSIPTRGFVVNGAKTLQVEVKE